MSTSSPDAEPRPKPGGLKRFFRSFGFAASGIVLLVRSEWNARFHLVATIAAIAAGFYFDITHLEWISIFLAMGMVWAAEALNTAIEWLCDRVESGCDERIRKAKDVAAGGVLCAAMAAAAVGLMIFAPRVLHWLAL